MEIVFLLSGAAILYLGICIGMNTTSKANAKPFKMPTLKMPTKDKPVVVEVDEENVNTFYQ